MQTEIISPYSLQIYHVITTIWQTVSMQTPADSGTCIAKLIASGPTSRNSKI